MPTRDELSNLREVDDDEETYENDRVDMINDLHSNQI